MGTFTSVAGSSSSSMVSDDKMVHSVVSYKGGFIASVGVARVVVCQIERPLKEIKPEQEITFKGISHSQILSNIEKKKYIKLIIVANKSQEI